MRISYPDYPITLSDSTIYTIPSAIQLNENGNVFMNYHPLHFNVLSASELQGSELIRAALNIPVETWDQLQLLSSTLDANAPLSINPLNNNISL